MRVSKQRRAGGKGSPHSVSVKKSGQSTEPKDDGATHPAVVHDNHPPANDEEEAKTTAADQAALDQEAAEAKEAEELRTAGNKDADDPESIAKDLAAAKVQASADAKALRDRKAAEGKKKVETEPEDTPYAIAIASVLAKGASPELLLKYLSQYQAPMPPGSPPLFPESPKQLITHLELWTMMRLLVLFRAR